MSAARVDGRKADQLRPVTLTRKWSIHPDQIAPINDIFSPSGDEVARAEALLAAYDAAPSGAAVFEGEMVDEASRKMAERVLRAGRAAGRVPLPDSADG